MTKAEEGNQVWSSRGAAALEVMLVFLVFFLYAGWPPPDVNEAHYVAKAKHYWQPDWCPTDHFLASADAHLVFYWTFGWLTRLAPLAVVAWIGRFLTWSLLAWSWRRLSWAVIPKPFASLLTACAFLLFNGRFHMAGEWVVGGVEAKGLAYALVFFALGSMLRQRWNAAWILLGLATAFHPLVGGWSMLAAGCAWLSCQHCRPPLTKMLPAICTALILALPGLIPALLLNRGVGAELVREANLIYVYQRLPHHLVFHRFPHWYMARHAILLVLWLAACRATPCQLSAGVAGPRPLRGFVAGAVLIAILGIVIDQSLLYHLDVAAGLLRYYWYRLSDAMLAAGAALAVVGWLAALRARRPAWGRTALIVAGLIAGGNLAWTNYERRNDLRPMADVQVLPAWESDPARHAPHVRRLAASLPMDRREHAGGRVFHHTQDAADVQMVRGTQRGVLLERCAAGCRGIDRMVAAATGLVSAQGGVGGLAAHGEQGLRELAKKYGADYVVLDRCVSPRPLSLRRVYPPVFSNAASAYEVYLIHDQ